MSTSVWWGDVVVVKSQRQRRKEEDNQDLISRSESKGSRRQNLGAIEDEANEVVGVGAVLGEGARRWWRGGVMAAN